MRAIERARPQECYAELYGPPARDPEIGITLISRYADAVRVLRDGSTFSNQTTLFPVLFQPTPEALGVMSELLGYPQAVATLDGEDHRQARGVAARSFPKNSTDVTPFLPDLLDELIEALRRSAGEAADGQAELVESFIGPLVLEVTIRTIGLLDSARDMRKLAKGQAQMVWGNPAPEDQVACAQDTIGVFRHCADAVDAQAAMEPDERPDTYISRLLSRDVPLDALKSNVFGVTSASFTTTTFALGNVVEDALQPNGAWQRLHDQPSDVPETVAEGLSSLTPVHGWLRQVTTDAEEAVVSGVRLEPGERLLVLLGAANLDPERPVDAPDLTFSVLPHRCLGASQAQYVMEEGLKRLTGEFPDMALAREPQRYADLSFNGPDELWVTLDAGQRSRGSYA